MAGHCQPGQFARTCFRQTIESMQFSLHPRAAFCGKKMNQNYAFWFTSRNLRRIAILSSKIGCLNLTKKLVLIAYFLEPFFVFTFPLLRTFLGGWQTSLIVSPRLLNSNNVRF